MKNMFYNNVILTMDLLLIIYLIFSSYILIVNKKLPIKNFKKA